MIFFDVGGTLLAQRVEPAGEIGAVLGRLGVVAPPKALVAALEALGHAYHAGVYAPATEAGERAFWQALAVVCLQRLPGGPSEPRVQGLAEALWAYPAWYAPLTGMVPLLEALAAAGRPLGVISNWPPSLSRALRHHGLGPFRVVACSGPLRCAKPDPGIFRWALEQAGVDAARTWYVGNDPVTDYLPARALGMRALLLDPGGRWAGEDLRRAGSAEELRGLLDEG